MAREAAGLVSSVSPPGVVGAEVEDSGQALPLHPEEAAHVAGAAEIRRRDFAAGRLAARTALSRLGLQDMVVGRAADGSPVWPADIVGSITHTKGYAAAMVARKSEFLAIGIDAERTGRVTDGMLPLLFGAQERAWLESFDPEARGVSATILFSAKEAYFKAFSPVTGEKLSLPTLEIRLDEEGFAVTRADARQGAWQGPVRGRLAIRGDLVITAICLPHPDD